MRTLKRQKQQEPQQSTNSVAPSPPTTHINATEANLKTNRGPPPQPPTQPPKNLSTVSNLFFLHKISVFY